jgi:uncharacterized protein (TIGR00369 family)
MSGLEYMQALVEGKFPPPPIAQTLGFALVEADEGRAVFAGEPAAYHYNPLGVVHGGLAATLLDSALACAIQTMLPQGMGYTTVQLNVNLVRAMTVNTGRVRCEGRVIHSGRQVATSEGDIRDSNGKLLAHGTTTCLVFPLPD